VAAEVDRLVRESELSRAEFASRIGTSTSRLSTYVTGKVTPSAALLVGMRRVISVGATPRQTRTYERGPQDGSYPPLRDMREG
jgi:transcriptional regulator with XRE-family HTH domain